uniref:Uncharacterized protein n=1 Tax=Anguilla anguilla TaxID=7936 RepID=A0A0E9P6W0_ANGAN
MENSDFGSSILYHISLFMYTQHCTAQPSHLSSLQTTGK